ncbi:hypothetical protein BN59_03247 [Legionella massiliensis]|uniref:Uncharacterized protein n=1 Tax=Legionella massiliensis TaxID=1034943 RepID=A0A078L143_9GAMM|nr:hypothetical protein BN59_03247 [Legionella massiliensis]CEE14670.1 hypothetical protein BN1094_03247 [Legionella massiliensis]
MQRSVIKVSFKFTLLWDFGMEVTYYSIFPQALHKSGV